MPGRSFVCLLLERIGVSYKLGEGEWKALRCTENPTAVPKAMGRRIDTAGFENTAAGSVIEGM